MANFLTINLLGPLFDPLNRSLVYSLMDSLYLYT